MKNISIKNIIKGFIKTKKLIIINGWVKTRRDSKSGISFLNIYDGSCLNTLQVIVKKKISNYKEILNLTTGCSVKIYGYIKKSIGIGQKFEVKAKKINIIGWVNKPNNYPISIKKHSLKYLRKFTHLRPRTNLIGVISRIRNSVSYTIHKFMKKKDFFWINTPLITSLNSEGAGKMFKVSTLNFNNLPKNLDGSINFKKDFFGKKTFLTVSGQLNIEAFACALSKVYTFGPTFRAENSNTTKHLSEFWMLEIEIAFKSLNYICKFSENLIKYILKKVLLECKEDINYLKNKIDKNIINRLKKTKNSNFKHIEYKNAINIINNCKIFLNNKITWGEDLKKEHEKYLVNKYFKKPVIIKNFPKNIKSFYMRINNDNKTVASMDILVPKIGEIIGGSQREERLKQLDKRLFEMKLKKSDYWWYRDLRKYGTVPHSGFGLGFERLISFITGIKNIKEAIPFPRTTKLII